MINLHFISSPLGTLQITEQDNNLLRLDFVGENKTPSNNAFFNNEINAYFKNPQHLFSFKLKLQGTEFQKRVWNALLAIPKGTCVTYGELAQQLKTSARAIGGACRANPIPIIVPCHRIVGAKNMGGYMGDTNGEKYKIKEFLLLHENCKRSP